MSKRLERDAAKRAEAEGGRPDESLNHLCELLLCVCVSGERVRRRRRGARDGVAWLSLSCSSCGARREPRGGETQAA